MLRAPASEKPTVFLYETYPGGVGFSDKLYTHHRRLFEAAVSLLSGCPCREGCPSCVGPDAETGPRGKRTALALVGLIAIGSVRTLGHATDEILKDNYRSVLAAQRMKEAAERLDRAALRMEGK